LKRGQANLLGGRAWRFELCPLVSKEVDGLDLLNFWRTKNGQEVDFILGGGEVAIEVKGTAMVDRRALRPMKSFIELYSPKHAIIVCNEPEERIHDKIKIMPWRLFLQKLWQDEILQ